MWSLVLLFASCAVVSATNWRILAKSSVSRDFGDVNCWDVSSLQFFADLKCSERIYVSNEDLISSGSVAAGFGVENVNDEDEGSVYGARSVDGNFGSSEIWFGATGLPQVKCVEVLQGDSSNNNCRPSESVELQISEDLESWYTYDVRSWSAENDGWNTMNGWQPIRPELSWRFQTDSTVLRDEGEYNCWDVIEFEFFEDYSCTEKITLSEDQLIVSGSAADFLPPSFMIDGDFDTVWGGRSVDGSHGSSEIWFGAAGVPEVKCAKLFQGKTEENGCSPSSSVRLQVSGDQGSNWETVVEYSWSSKNDYQWVVMRERFCPVLDLSPSDGGCPVGWTCSGPTHTQDSFLFLGSDDDQGTARSQNFLLADMYNLHYQQAGGADYPNGLSVRRASDDAVLCQMNPGTDTNEFYDTECGDLSGFQGEEVYIYVDLFSVGGWSKYFVRDIAMVNQHGAAVCGDVVYRGTQHDEL